MVNRLATLLVTLLLAGSTTACGSSLFLWSGPFTLASGYTITGAKTTISANDARLGTSDYCSVSVNSSRIRFTRPTVDGLGQENTNPGARVRFNISGADGVVLNLHYTALVTRLDTYQPVGLILVDGSVASTFSSISPAGTPAALSVGVSLSTGNHLVELVEPYAASIDVISIDTPAAAMVTAPAARTSTRYVASGDSITQGFWAANISTTWGYQLAAAKGWQYINHGYGGRACVTADGTTAANLNPDVATYMIGYNDFGSQTPLVTFKANFTSVINNFRAVKPSVKIYCITPIWSPNTNTLTLEMYRQQIRDALTALGNPLNVLVEGGTLMTNDSSRLLDGVHPNDAGSAEIAAALQAVVNL